jgi:hypothetical protein
VRRQVVAAPSIDADDGAFLSRLTRRLAGMFGEIF